MNICFYGYSPASVNSCTPLIKYFAINNKEVNIYLFMDSEFAIEQWTPLVDSYNLKQVNNFNEMDICVYGTGSGHDKELTIPLRVNESTITVAIHDVLFNDGYDRRYKNLPNILIVNTPQQLKSAKEKLGKEVNVLQYGNPHYERLLYFTNDTGDLIDRVAYISKCGTGGTYNEPTSEDSIEDILQLLQLKEMGEIKDLIIYKHPRENLDFYNSKGLTPSDTNEFSHMMKNKLIIGRDSTPVYEAMLIGKPVIFGGSNLTSKLVNKTYDTLGTFRLDKDINSTYNICQFILNIK